MGTTHRFPALAAAGLVAVLAAGTPAVAANPPTRNIYLHYDYMVGPDHSHAPDPRAIALVVEAFRRQGITLHIDPQHTAIPERRVITSGPVDPKCAGPDAVSLGDLKKTHFTPHGNHDWHYAVFAHRAQTPDFAHAAYCPPDPLCRGLPEPISTGFAEIGGRNFVVALGAIQEEGASPSIGLQAATLMHELGHNLGLTHGGSAEQVCLNQMPNYISVMNYTYQLIGGIPFAASPGSAELKACIVDADCGRGAFCEHNVDAGLRYCARIDYSARELATLLESSPAPGIGGMDENVGVGGLPTDTDLVLWFAPGNAQLIAASFGPIDWNDDGALDTHVAWDVNDDTVEGLLRGFDDWAFVHASLGTPHYHNAARRTNSPVAHCSGH